MTPVAVRLRALAVRILDQRTVERIVDPHLADLEMEHAEAIQRGHPWRSRWILILGLVAFLKTVALCLPGEVVRVSRSWTIEDRENLSRALKFSAAAGVMATLALPLPLVRRVGLSDPRMFVYLVPQTIVLAVPIGLTVGVFLGLRGRTLSSRSTRAVFACAIFFSCACLATLAWVVPSAQKEFRQAGLRQTMANDVNELTLGELSERLRVSSRTALLDRPALAYTYHMRWAFSCATLVLALFALAMTRRIVARWAVALAAVSACFGYYVLMWIGRAGALQQTLPAVVGAWLPNAVFVLVWLALTTVTPRGQNAQA